MFTKLRNLLIHYETIGTGQDVILLHGWGASVDSFKPTIEHLASAYHVYAIDLPGFGKSQSPDTPWGVMEYAEIVKEFMDVMQIQTPILIGHSFGGRVIIYLTGKMNFSAKKIVLIDSAGIKPRYTVAYYVKVFLFKLSKSLLSIFLPQKWSSSIIEKARCFFGSSDYSNASGVLRETMVKVVNEDLREHLPHIDVPTLLVWGEKDTVTPVSDGVLMEQLINNSGLVVLKGAGHFSYLERQVQFNLIISSFLRDDIVRE